MLRGFRWQLIALIMAILLFVIGVVYRSSIQPVPQPTQAASVPTQTIEPTASPTIQPSDTTLSTPIPETPATVSQQSDSPTYREGLIGNIQRLNPIFAHLNPVDNDLSSLIFEGLMTTNDFGEPILDLASNYVVSSDGLEYVFTLRDDVLWQDGQPFNADDVLYTMSLLSSPDYAGFSPIAQFWQTIETQKLADNLIRFRLTQPLGSFANYLTIGILPEHALTGTGVTQLATHPFNLSPIGTGPYQLSTLSSSNDARIDEIILQKSPIYERRPEAQSGYFYRDLVFKLFDNASDAIQAYSNGELDALANVAPRSDLMFLPDSRIYTQIEPDVTMLIFNWNADDRRIFAERRIRQALSYGLDQVSIVERHLSTDSAIADSPLIPGSWAYTPNTNWTTYDLTQALQILDSVTIQQPEPVSGTEGESIGEISTLYSFSILVEDKSPLPAIASDIATQWGQLGFAVSVDTVDREAFENRIQSGDFQSAIVTLSIGSDPDVYRYWHPGQYENGQNYGAVNNNEVAEVLELARQDNNGINRTNLYQQFQQRFAEQAIAIPLYYPLYTFVAHDSIEGIKLGFLGTSANRFRSISQWQPASLTD